MGFLVEEGIELYQIPGNHDKTDLDSPDSYLDMFDRVYSTYHLFKEEEAVKINGVLCCFLPYFLESGSYPKRLKKIAKKASKSSAKYKYLFTHIAVNGVKKAVRNSREAAPILLMLYDSDVRADGDLQTNSNRPMAGNLLRSAYARQAIVVTKFHLEAAQTPP